MAQTCVDRMSCFRGLTGILLVLHLPLLATSTKASDGLGWGALSEVGHWSNENHTRVIIQLTREVRFEQLILFRPDRIYFDLHNTVMKSNLHGKTYAVTVSSSGGCE